MMPRTTALINDIIAPLHFADDPMQQARSDYFVLAKLGRDVLKQGIAIGGLSQAALPCRLTDAKINS
jgi:hypothetical protein